MVATGEARMKLEIYSYHFAEEIHALRAGTLTRPMDRPVYDPALVYGGHQ